MLLMFSEAESAWPQTEEASARRLTATVAALCRPQTYLGHERSIESIETHHSWVFLTQSHAYKLKKPTCTAQRDYSTLEARRLACETELRLNRRLALSAYLAVVPLCLEHGQARVEGPGEAIEWLVKMRRLPREWMLDALIERERLQHDGTTLDGAALAALAQLLTAFYRTAPRAGWTGAEYRQRIASGIEGTRASLEQPRYGLDLAPLRTLVNDQRRWLEAHATQLEARAPLVVEAHGDLRPEHVCVGPEPLVIDCLDFDRELRLLDPVSELAFLALECRRLGSAWIGERLLSLYRAQTGDDFGDGLVRFYESYHALIRAATSAWHLDEGTDRASAWQARAAEYLHLGCQCAPAPR